MGMRLYLWRIPNPSLDLLDLLDHISSSSMWWSTYLMSDYQPVPWQYTKESFGASGGVNKLAAIYAATARPALGT